MQPTSSGATCFWVVGMLQTLARLCMQQLGLRAAPFIVGFAPAAVRHIRNKPGKTIQGREVRQNHFFCVFFFLAVARTS